MASGISIAELNMRCAGVKRLLKEACELRNPNELLYAKPMEDNLFEWHFTIRGPPDTVYQNGVYHGRIILPVDYPMKPPNLILLTPNGRFETNKKVCLSISGYHPETWLPSWSIRTALMALVAFMPSHPRGALGGLECSDIERRRLAAKSLNWRCDTCSCAMRDILPLMVENVASAAGKVKNIDNFAVSKNYSTFHKSTSVDPANRNDSAAANSSSTAEGTTENRASSAISSTTDSTLTSLDALQTTGHSWHLLLYIVLFSTAFVALLIRRLSNP